MPDRIRAPLERQLGTSFRDVRIRQDVAAHALNATLGSRAVASGNQIWLRRDQSRNDAALMRHELAHVAQQREQATTSLQLLRVQPDGEFARALEDFTDGHRVPDAVVGLLRNSPTFAENVRILNQHYAWTGSLGMRDTWPAGGGRITGGRFTGRRMIEVAFGDGATFFEPESPTSGQANDVIWIHPRPPSTFIEEVAHETSHAVALVSRAGGGAPSSIMGEIAGVVAEEGSVREREHRIVREVFSAANARDRRRFGLTRPSMGRPSPRAIERDFSRMPLRLTYFEHAFFHASLRRVPTGDPGDFRSLDARAVESRPILDPSVQALVANPSRRRVLDFWVTHVPRAPGGRPPGPTAVAMGLQYMRRVLARSWELAEPNGRGVPARTREQVASAHASILSALSSLLFGESVSYTP